MEKEQPEYLYHYTTMSALFGMLNNIKRGKDDSIKFWASHILYMNDPTEYDFFITTLDEAISDYERKNELSPPEDRLKNVYDMIARMGGELFVLSLTECNDTLSMWRAYGANGQGIAIQLKTESLKSVEKNGIGHFRKNIYYKKDELKQQFKEEDLSCFHKSLKDNKMQIIPDILNNRIVYKDSVYSDEKEWRIFKHCPEYDFREKGGLIVPYVEIDIPLSAVDAFIIGPCANYKYSEMSLQMMLDKKLGNNDIKILCSDCPYVIR